MIYALILAGGKGTRLYPLSRSQKPKQFLKIINDSSFLVNTVRRIEPLVDKKNLYVITNKEYKDKISEELPELPGSNIFVEPYNRETATCIGYAAVKLLKKDKDALMVVLPSDHYIENQNEFLETIKEASEMAERKRALITIGINPTRPETGYGYIEMGERLNYSFPCFKVERFLEKPNLEVAKDLLQKGTYLWNSGMFVLRADIFLRECEKYLPKLYKSLMDIYQSIDTDFEEEVINNSYKYIDGISMDFGIMQKTRKAYVIKSTFPWDDIGNFLALSRFLKREETNNVSGNTFLEDCEDCCIFGEKQLIIGFGLKDIVIVDSGDVMLIMNKSKDQELKQLINELKSVKGMDKYL